MSNVLLTLLPEDPGGDFAPAAVWMRFAVSIKTTITNLKQIIDTDLISTNSHTFLDQFWEIGYTSRQYISPDGDFFDYFALCK